MRKCEKCPRSIELDQTLCRYHRVEEQSNRVNKTEIAIGVGGKALPYLMIMLMPNLRKIKGQ